MSNTRKKISQLGMVVAAAAITASSCTTVKEYQKNRLNDGEMVLGNRKVEKTENSFQTGGGCGCN
jgi:hypothetical protein